MKTILLNMLMNVVLAAALVLLSNRALTNGLEETLVSLAVLFGLVTIAANAVFTAFVSKRQD